jgi:AcrR family transcriptional regulator
MQANAKPRGRGRPKAASDPTLPSRASQIVDAAIQVFAVNGYDGASMRQIAGEAGVDPALLVHKFGSKLGLWRAAVDAVAVRLVTTIQGIGVAPGGHDPSAHLIFVMDHLIDLNCDMPQIAQFLLKEIVMQDSRFQYIFERLVQPIHDLVMPLIQAANDGPTTDDVDPDFRFFSIAGAIVTTVVSRPFMMRMSPSASSDLKFRENLKRAVHAQLSPFITKDAVHGT